VNRLRTGLVIGVLLSVIAAGTQGVAAFGASSPSPLPPSPDKAQRIEAEQSRAASAGQALGLSSGEKLSVKDVMTDPDGSTHVRYNRTFNGLRVIGGDLVSHRAKSGAVKGVTWNATHGVGVASTTPKISLDSAKAVGARKASFVQQTTSATKIDLVVYAGGATPKLSYAVLTEGVRADQTPSRLHTIVNADTGGTLASWDEIENGTGHGINVGTVPIGTTPGASFSMRDAAGHNTTDLNGLGDGTGIDIGSSSTSPVTR